MINPITAFKNVIKKNVKNTAQGVANQSFTSFAPIRPDSFTMTPEIKNRIHEQVKKFDKPNFLQKACRFISKTKVGKAIMFGILSLVAVLTGKAVADDIEKSE